MKAVVRLTENQIQLLLDMLLRYQEEDSEVLGSLYVELEQIMKLFNSEVIDFERS